MLCNNATELLNNRCEEVIDFAKLLIISIRGIQKLGEILLSESYKTVLQCRNNQILRCKRTDEVLFKF